MTDDAIESHYTRGTLLDEIVAGLVAAGKDLDALTPDDLAPVDEFHIRGRESTVELAGRVALAAGQSVLDVGCGIGGSARFLASTYGCAVVGVDLTAEYIDAGNALSARVGLADRVTLRQASALDLPFSDQSFDVVWTEHVQMNVADKRAFYASLARVLRPGGRLLFHDVFQGPGGPPHYPVPWANEPSISHLATPEDVAAIVRGVGLTVVAWEDRSAVSRAWFDAMSHRMATVGPAPVGLHLLMGTTFPTKFANMRRNVTEGRLAVVQAVCARS